MPTTEPLPSTTDLTGDTADIAIEDSTPPGISPDDDLNRIIQSASRLGVELDEEATRLWLESIAAEADEELVVSDVDSGAFGHRVAMLDFSPRDLERLRRIGKIVEVTPPAPMIESALAISGSSAQSKIQLYPGDCDYFQRLNIRADTRDEACRIMADLLRDKVLRTAHGPTCQFRDAKLGSYPFDCKHGTQAARKGSPITWTLDEIQAKGVRLEHRDGTSTTVHWHEAALDPGWCKLDWVVSDPERRQLSNASNVIDVTWEAPDGEIVPLDGYLDAYFQEVYLDPESVPVFAKVVKFVSEDALDGAEETAIVKALFRLRRSLEDQHSGERRISAVEAAQTQVINVVNTFFRERLVSMPTIDDYIANIQGSGEA